MSCSGLETVFDDVKCGISYLHRRASSFPLFFFLSYLQALWISQSLTTKILPTAVASEKIFLSITAHFSFFMMQAVKMTVCQLRSLSSTQLISGGKKDCNYTDQLVHIFTCFEVLFFCSSRSAAF